jgi:hypothetical protein
MARLDVERQKALEPVRMAAAKEALEKLGYTVEQHGATKLQFTYKGARITLYPYSGWATGTTIQDGRGLQNLLKQLK